MSLRPKIMKLMLIINAPCTWRGTLKVDGNHVCIWFNRSSRTIIDINLFLLKTEILVATEYLGAQAHPDNAVNAPSLSVE